MWESVGKESLHNTKLNRKNVCLEKFLLTTVTSVLKADMGKKSKFGSPEKITVTNLSPLSTRTLGILSQLSPSLVSP